MTDSNVEILGVYRVPMTKELIEQTEREMGCSTDEDRDVCRALLADLVVVEMRVTDPDDEFDVSEILHYVEDDEDSDQAAWAETYLKLDGETLLFPRWPEDPPDLEDVFRVAFFIHFWDDSERLLDTSFGEIECLPTEEKMPDRLATLMPYEYFG